MDYQIIHLPKEEWKDTILHMNYTTKEYYDVSMERIHRLYTIKIEKKNFTEPVTQSSEKYNFPDKLYADYREKSFAWGVLVEGKLVSAIETTPEEWSNRLRIEELWVDDAYQKQGIGHSLMEIAKEQARQERRRAIILETQSCNVNAIDFYHHEGFQLIGMDTCAYTNDDLDRKEVRLELGWFPESKKKLRKEEIEIRMETEEDWYDVERMTQLAFWNKHHLGCDEHYLVHKLRQHKDYIPELSRIAVKNGEVIGCIMYSKSWVIDGDAKHQVLTFGPLCVDPRWQGSGVGGLLIKETMKLAAEQGYSGIIIFGEPDYYPLYGFKTCDHFNITTADGKNFDPFMGIELFEDSLKDIKGKFHESDVFNNLPSEEVEEYNKKFPYLPKVKFPSQWD